MRTHLALAAALLAVAAPAARAQSDAPPSFSRAPSPAGASRFALGLSFDVAQPVGEFRSTVANGWGGSGHALVRVDGAGVLALRADAGLLSYGRSRADAAVPGFPDLYRETSHQIFWAGVGPQLMVPGGPVRPYVNAQVGLAVFNTGTTLKRDEPFDDDDDVDYRNDDNDATRTWGAGGGVLVRLGRGASLDLGARYHNNGAVAYRYEGPGGAGAGGVAGYGRANLWTYRIGLSLGGW